MFSFYTAERIAKWTVKFPKKWRMEDFMANTVPHINRTSFKGEDVTTGVLKQSLINKITGCNNDEDLVRKFPSASHYIQFLIVGDSEPTMIGTFSGKCKTHEKCSQNCQWLEITDLVNEEKKGKIQTINVMMPDHIHQVTQRYFRCIPRKNRKPASEHSTKGKVALYGCSNNIVFNGGKPDHMITINNETIRCFKKGTAVCDSIYWSLYQSLVFGPGATSIGLCDVYLYD